MQHVTYAEELLAKPKKNKVLEKKIEKFDLLEKKLSDILQLNNTQKQGKPNTDNRLQPSNLEAIENDAFGKMQR